MSGGVVLHSAFLDSIFLCPLENLPPFIPGKAWIMPGLMQIPGLAQQRKTRFLRFPPWESRKDAATVAGVMQAGASGLCNMPKRCSVWRFDGHHMAPHKKSGAMSAGRLTGCTKTQTNATCAQG